MNNLNRRRKVLIVLLCAHMSGVLLGACQPEKNHGMSNPTLGSNANSSFNPLPLPSSTPGTGTGTGAVGSAGFTLGVSYNGVPSTFERIRINSLHQRGFRGRGIRVAILDDGVNFRNSALTGKELLGAGYFFGPDLRILLRSELFNFGLDGQNLYRQGQHGTDMAMILAGARDHLGHVGIAPAVQIAPYSNNPNMIFSSILHGQNQLNVKIANISLVDVTLDLFRNPNRENMRNRARDFGQIAGTAIVIIAGNGGSTHATSMETGLPDQYHPPTGNFIVTVGVDEENRLTSTSNRCGRTRSFCIAVPTIDTTSETAPIVSGALAILMEAYPGRPVREYVQAILNSATSTGYSGDETGRGLLNVEGALNFLNESSNGS